MHFSIPLILAVAGLSAAAPTAPSKVQSGPMTISDIVDPIISNDKNSLEKRVDVGTIIAFWSGEWMNKDQMEKGIDTWCSSMNGQVVPQGKSLNSQINGLTLHNGGPGVLAAHYTNDKIRTGWTIDGNECKTWMKKIMTDTATLSSDGTHSQGGYGKVGNLGSIWVDPNAA